MRGIVGEFEAADPAAQTVPERAVRLLTADEFVADPDTKDAGEEDQKAGEDKPGEFDVDHWAATGRRSVPQRKVTNPHETSDGSGANFNPRRTPAALPSSEAFPELCC